MPILKDWQKSKKRQSWFESLGDERLCLVIGIEIVSYNLEMLDKNHALMSSVLERVYSQSLAPKRFAAREYYNSVRRQMNVQMEDHDASWSFLYLINSIVKGANLASELQRAVGSSASAISWEPQIQAIGWILLAHQEFGLPCSLEELGICNDWLEENGMQRLRLEAVLSG